ncbi:MAG: hypothetical protein OHK93_006769 [Ramalina farinacea]|uniref:DUF676 domain-containing protein n=1 Tax=Ramalina farinacea TaxID=258253 RepID=A0AA43TTT9_9LECA|nr:hypothetical protein [Ramalina farinacea]
MSFPYSSLPDWSKIKADIIFIPAIGADPRLTWARQTGTERTERLDYEIFDHLGGEARVHLYDHLIEKERKLQIPRQTSEATSEALSDDQHDALIAFRETGRRLDDFGVEDWANRLYEFLFSFQQISARPVLSDRSYQTNRPIIFICHSTGGNVLKHALTKRSEGVPNPIALNTIGITFFGVPHHGSSVLSNDEYVQTVQAHLGLKWKMSGRLRQDFRLRDENQELERLNHRFAVDIVGVKIFNYVEMADTNLRVLTDENSGESTTIIRLCVVDSRSGKLGTPQVPMEDEDFMQLDVTHTDLPRFTDQQDQYDSFVSEIGKLVREFKESDRVEYRLLQKAINTEVKVHVHQFYEDKGSIKILMTQPTLNRFLEVGPSRAIMDEIEGRDKNIRSPRYVFPSK